MTFEGSLSELSFADIIQLLSVSRKTGVLHITNASHRGDVYLHDGQIVHALVGNVGGEEAVYTLATTSLGSFQFDLGIATELRTISQSNTTLLVEAARRLDEWRLVSKKIPSTDLVPECVDQRGRDGPISLGRAEWLILSKLDGRRSVKLIAAATGQGPFETAKVLYGLVAAGLVRLRKPIDVPIGRHLPVGRQSSLSGSPGSSEGHRTRPVSQSPALAHSP
jgi:hypothetical protein